MGSRWCAWVRRRTRWRRVGQWLPQGPTELHVIGLDFTARLHYEPRRGYWCAGTYRGRGCLGPPIATYPRPEAPMKRRQIIAAMPVSGPQHIAPIDSRILSQVLNVISHCCIVRYDDGSPRRPGWVTLQTQGASWMLVAKDPDSSAQLRVVGPTLDDAFALLDMLLGAEDAPWEPDRFLQGMANGKKK
jgi:hypothetical protein